MRKPSLPKEVNTYIESAAESNITPYVIEKTRDGEVLYDIFSRLIKERIVFLAEEINYHSATTISATLLWLDHQNDGDISLYINSPGGSITDGLFTIYDTMQYIKSPIKTVCIGEAYSAGACILCAGTSGKRMAFENSHVMVHEVQVGPLPGPLSEIEKDAGRYKSLSDRVYKLISKHTGNSIEKVKELCQAETYMNAKEAMEFGLIDKIVLPSKHTPNANSPSPKNAKKRRSSR